MALGFQIWLWECKGWGDSRQGDFGGVVKNGSSPMEKPLIFKIFDGNPNEDKQYDK